MALAQATLLLTLAMALPVRADGPLPRYGVAMFTNQCLSEQSGDLYGARLTLRRIGKVDDAVLERADYPPLVIWPVTWDAAQPGHLAFQIPAGAAPAAPVAGQLSHDGLTLTLKGLYGDPARADVMQRMSDLRRDTRVCSPR